MIKKVLASIVLIVMASVYLLTPLLTGDLDDNHLSAYSQDFDDLSDFKTDLDAYSKYFEEEEKVDHDGYEIYTIMGSPTLLNGPDIDPEHTLYIAVGIENRYSDADIEAIIAFVKAGGKAIIADDYGFGYELAGNYGVTYYRNKFYDQEYDRNENFTVVTARLGVDHFTPKIVSTGNQTGENLIINENDRHEPDGHWDDDQDCDGRIDEDPFEKGVPIDDDADKGRSAEDGIDNDHDYLEDQEDPNEGLNEDPRDDDGDSVDLNNNGVEDPMVWYDANGDDKFTWVDLNGNGDYDRGESYVTVGADDIDEYVSGDFGVDEEILDGLDNDGDWIQSKHDTNNNGKADPGEFGVDEDLRPFRILLNDATGMTSVGTRVIAHGSQNSFIDMDETKGINRPEGPGKLADERSSPGNEIQIIVEVVVCPECGGAIDLRSGECLNTLETRTGEKCKEYHNSEEYLDFGKIIFMSDSNLLTNDLYSLDHLVTDDRTGEVYQETDPIPVSEWEGAPEDRVSSEDDDDSNNIVDKTADGELDYDNRVFLRRLIEYLLPNGGLIIFDESRHAQDDPFLIPVYSTLYALAYITSDPFYGTALVLVFTFILFFLVLIIRDKESWVHNHNIGIFKGRKAVPSNTTAQVARLRHAIIERVRMNRGLSSEEFQQLGPKAAETMVNDPYLLDVLKNEGRAYSETEMKNIMDRVRKLAT